MKLTNTIRSAFVRAVMDDVPSVDYEAEQQRIVLAWAVSIMPAKVRAVWEDKSTRDYIELHYLGLSLHFDGKSTYVRLSSLPVEQHVAADMPEELKRELFDLEMKDVAQCENRRKLQTSLEGVAMSVTTTNALAVALPEFAKYIPKDQAKSSNLPALANVVTDFVKAGWPKHEAS